MITTSSFRCLHSAQSATMHIVSSIVLCAAIWSRTSYGGCPEGTQKIKYSDRTVCYLFLDPWEMQIFRVHIFKDAKYEGGQTTSKYAPFRADTREQALSMCNSLGKLTRMNDSTKDGNQKEYYRFENSSWTNIAKHKTAFTLPTVTEKKDFENEVLPKVRNFLINIRQVEIDDRYFKGEVFHFFLDGKASKHSLIGSGPTNKITEITWDGSPHGCAYYVSNNVTPGQNGLYRVNCDKTFNDVDASVTQRFQTVICEFREPADCVVNEFKTCTPIDASRCVHTINRTTTPGHPLGQPCPSPPPPVPVSKLQDCSGENLVQCNRDCIKGEMEDLVDDCKGCEEVRKKEKVIRPAWFNGVCVPRDEGAGYTCPKCQRNHDQPYFLDKACMIFVALVFMTVRFKL